EGAEGGRCGALAGGGEVGGVDPRLDVGPVPAGELVVVDEERRDVAEEGVAEASADNGPSGARRQRDGIRGRRVVLDAVDARGPLARDRRDVVEPPVGERERRVPGALSCGGAEGVVDDAVGEW